MLESAAQTSNGRAPILRRSRADRARIDGRSAQARQVKDLAASYVAHGAEPRAALRAAELVIIAADLRAARLRGELSDVAALLKAEGYADRAVRALGVDMRPKPPPMKSLQQLMAGIE